MKRLFLSIVLAVAYANSAFGDAFQFVRGESEALMVGAEISRDGKVVGYTNDQGIIVIKSPLGRHVYQIKHMGRTKEVGLNVSGDARLQVIQMK